MTRWAMLMLVALTLVIGACANLPTRPPVDVLSDATRSGVIFAETACTKKIGDKCVVATCKKNEKFDCRAFANGCLDTGHQYTGTAEGGT